MRGVGKLNHNAGSARGKGGEGAGSIQQSDLPNPAQNRRGSEMEGRVLKNQEGTREAGGEGGVLNVKTRS